MGIHIGGRKKKTKLPRFCSDGSANLPMRDLIQIHRTKLTRTYLPSKHLYNEDDDYTSDSSEVLTQDGKKSESSSLAPAIVLAVNSIWCRDQEFYDYRKYDDNDGVHPCSDSEFQSGTQYFPDGQINEYDVLHSGNIAGDNFHDNDGEFHGDDSNFEGDQHFYNDEDQHSNKDDTEFYDGDGEFHGGHDNFDDCAEQSFYNDEHDGKHYGDDY